MYEALLLTFAAARSGPEQMTVDTDIPSPIPRPGLASAEHIAMAARHVPHNYSPLPVVAASAQGAWITDVAGARYLDCLAGYSALNFGHRNPQILAALGGTIEARLPGDTPLSVSSGYAAWIPDGDPDVVVRASSSRALFFRARVPVNDPAGSASEK